MNTPAAPTPVVALEILTAPGPAGGLTITDPYIEQFWLPRIGPGSFVVLRRIALLTLAGTTDVTITAPELGHLVGLGPDRVIQALHRLTHFGLALTIAPGKLVVPHRVPPLSRHLARRLSGPLAACEAHLRLAARA